MKFFDCFLIGALLFSACGSQPKKEQANPPPEPSTPLFDVSLMPEEPLFDMETTLGTMRIKLYKETPGHRDNFAKLVSERYYDGIIFHRIIKGFMIQAGNLGQTPTKAQLNYGPSGVDYKIPAEILPAFTHKRGSLAAARDGNPEKASSGAQFYIVLSDNGATHLNGSYTIYGEVVDGFEVLDAIAALPVTRNERGEMASPVKAPEILSITPAF